MFKPNKIITVMSIILLKKKIMHIFPFLEYSSTASHSSSPNMTAIGLALPIWIL